MTDPLFFIGKPRNFKNICYIYPPKIDDMIKTDENFFNKAQVFLISQENIEDEYVKNDQDISEMPTPFEQLLSMAYNMPEMKKQIEDAFYQFTHESITFFFNLKKIAFGSKEEIIATCKRIEDIRFLTEEAYFDFQNIIRQSLSIPVAEPYNPLEDPRVRRIKAKKRYREQVKAKQGIGLSLVDSISSICCMGIGLNPLNIGELTYVAANELIARYSDKEKFDIDLHTIWAGADQKKHKITPKHWIRNLEE